MSPLSGAGSSADAGGPRPAAALVVLGVGAVVVVAASLVPGWRQPLLVATSLASAAVIVLAVLRRQPEPAWPWLVLAAMMVAGGAATLLALSPTDVGPLAATAMVAAQLGAATVGVHVAFVPTRQRRHRPPLTDVAIITVALGLVGAHVVLVASDRGARTATALVTPSVDVLFLVLVVVYAVSRATMVPAVVLGIAGACVYLVVDLATALGGQRLAAPGDPLQVVGLAVGILYAASALLPSMTDAFDDAQLALRRSPSSALARLLPLMAVPLALWVVAEAGSVRGLPVPVLVAAGAAMGVLCLVRAATALRSTETMARHDALTGLPNRHGLDVLQAGSTGERHRSHGSHGLVLVDVDDFKNINDTHGHDVGDRALLAIRDRLVAAAGGDAVVGRLGGDEFALLVSAERADQVSGDVLVALRSPVRVDGLDLRVRASVGVALPAPPGEDATGTGFGDGGAGSLSELLTHADVALYAAKAAGRDQVVVYRPQMRVDVAHRFTLCNELRHLLGGCDARAGRLEVHYQVLVDLASEEAVGAEALVRWRHPRLGLLAPYAFLEHVTASGLDAALDEAVLREVVDQIARWRSQGRTVAPVSVNLTRDSLVRDDLVELVLTLLVDSGVPASLLHLEITEHEALPDDAAIADRLIELDRAGVRIHLDDYGTGYTSMDYLRRFPVRVLKIDRAVTATLDELLGAGPEHDRCSISSFRGSIVGGLVAMSDALGIDLLAEGVETAEQAATLRSLGVRYAQGYLYGRPVPAVDHAVAACSAAGPPSATAYDDAAAAAAAAAALAPPAAVSPGLTRT